MVSFDIRLKDDALKIGIFSHFVALLSHLASMRILIVHNHYQDPGGEDTVVAQEAHLLAQTENVELLTFRNRRGWRGVLQTLWSPWNIWAGQKVKRAIKRHQPDIMHIHNLHYAVGPIAIRIAKRQGIPVVMTLHNYRLICPSATLFYNGKLFTGSLHARFPWRAVRLGVHSHSRIKTFWLALTIWLHKKGGTWQMTDRYITLTDFAKQLFIDSSLGVSAEKYVTKPNFVSTGERKELPTAPSRTDGFLFIGRLTEEKGLSILLEAFAGTEFRLQIVGDGPLRNEVMRAVRTSPNITYLGALERAAIDPLLTSCTALIFPSTWYEGMPMTLLEAFAAGTPVIASNLGAMQSMVHEGQNGWLFAPGDAQALRDKVKLWLGTDDVYRQHLGTGARQSYESLYTAKWNQLLLADLYGSVIESHLRRK